MRYINEILTEAVSKLSETIQIHHIAEISPNLYGVTLLRPHNLGDYQSALFADCGDISGLYSISNASKKYFEIQTTNISATALGTVTFAPVYASGTFAEIEKYLKNTKAHNKTFPVIGLLNPYSESLDESTKEVTATGTIFIASRSDDRLNSEQRESLILSAQKRLSTMLLHAIRRTREVNNVNKWEIITTEKPANLTNFNNTDWLFIDFDIRLSATTNVC